MPNRLWVALAFLVCLAAAPPQGGQDRALPEPPSKIASQGLAPAVCHFEERVQEVEKQLREEKAAQLRREEQRDDAASKNFPFDFLANDTSPFEPPVKLTQADGSGIFRCNNADARRPQGEMDTAVVDEPLGCWTQGLTAFGLPDQWLPALPEPAIVHLQPLTIHLTAVSSLTMLQTLDDYLDKSRESQELDPEVRPWGGQYLLEKAQRREARNRKKADTLPLIQCNARRIRLHYRVDEVSFHDSSTLELWVTRDGCMWQQYHCEKSPTGPLVVELPEQGRYGLRLVVRKHAARHEVAPGEPCDPPEDSVSFGSPRPKMGDAPHVWIEIDEAIPTLPGPVPLHKVLAGGAFWLCRSWTVDPEEAARNSHSSMESLACLPCVIENRDQVGWITPATGLQGICSAGADGQARQKNVVSAIRLVRVDAEEKEPEVQVFNFGGWSR